MIAEIIEYLYPGIKSIRDYELQDNMDGKGVIIVKWNRPEPKPTIDYILSKQTEYLSSK